MNTRAALLRRFTAPCYARYGYRAFSSARVAVASEEEELAYHTHKAMEQVYGPNWKNIEFFFHNRQQKVPRVVPDVQVRLPLTFESKAEEEEFILCIKHSEGGF